MELKKWIDRVALARVAYTYSFFFFFWFFAGPKFSFVTCTVRRLPHHSMVCAVIIIRYIWFWISNWIKWVNSLEGIIMIIITISLYSVLYCNLGDNFLCVQCLFHYSNNLHTSWWWFSNRWTSLSMKHIDANTWKKLSGNTKFQLVKNHWL